MSCVRCGREIADEALYCQFCGADQRVNPTPQGTSTYRLRRSVVDRQIAGVCGGIARYFETDPVFIRVAWVILTIVPGAIFLGILAYLVAWLIIPEAEPGTEPTAPADPTTSWRRRRLKRSANDAKMGGVCGGIAEYFAVDSTAIRLLWVLLSIFPGAIICGVLTYIVAWFIMPPAPVPPQPAPATATGSE